jgi:Fe-S-cluster containining protein
MPSESLSARRLGDRLLLQEVDAAFTESARRAGPACACRVGCTECCMGPFPINALDAWRLREGLRALDEASPTTAQAVRARARAAVDLVAETFPGPRGTGTLGNDEDAEEAFWERFASLPCPALDPATGACDLHEWRPVSCRTYGPPVRFGTQALPQCRLWFVGAPASAIEDARVEPDPEDRERGLLASVEQDANGGDTIVAYALLRQGGE